MGPLPIVGPRTRGLHFSISLSPGRGIEHGPGGVESYPEPIINVHHTRHSPPLPLLALLFHQSLSPIQPPWTPYTHRTHHLGHWSQ